MRPVNPKVDKYIEKMIQYAQEAKKRVAEKKEQAKAAALWVEERKAAEAKS